MTTTASRRRPGNASDAISSFIPGEVIEPASVGELQEVLREGAGGKRAVVFAGNRTKMDWGSPPERLDAVVSVRDLPATIEHEASDLVVKVGVGVPLDALQQVLVQSGQRLAVDELVPGTTVGGLLSTGISGPLRYGYGAVRDLVIGISVVRADGALARSGGRVVKNVAGFDLAKLFTGSYGTLGCITEAYFRLHALPESRRYVTSELTFEEGEEALARLVQTQTAPSAIECHSETNHSGLMIGVLVEGPEASTIIRSNKVASLLGGRAELHDEAPVWWGLPSENFLLKCTAEISEVTRVASAIMEAGRTFHLAPVLTGSAGVGAVFVGFNANEDGPFDAVRGFVDRIRLLVSAAGGSAVVLDAPPLAKRALDIYGPVPAISLMRRVKEEFDPERLLAPGRFVGGI